MSRLLPALAQKLSYSEKELCENPRIQDIYHERKLVYNAQTDVYDPYEFVTIHYNEYSCEYQYDLTRERWGRQNCYNTW